MARFRAHIMVALLTLASLALPGSSAECNTEDGVFTINLEELGIDFGGCGDDDCHDHHEDDHDDCFFCDSWW